MMLAFWSLPAAVSFQLILSEHKKYGSICKIEPYHRRGGDIMTPVSAYEFFRRNGRIYINGNLIEFISYEDYLDYLS